MTMKTNLLTAAALLTLTMSAHAQTPLKPEATAAKETLGTWCRAGALAYMCWKEIKEGKVK
jgi:hypothetical protein